MNLAVLVSVSNYSNQEHNLPACSNDHALMDAVLTHSGKFTEILKLSTDTCSSYVKSELARFIKSHKGKKCDEIFFYYTGHGEFYNEDFYFLFSDYEDSRRQQTALSNAELDAMLRSLSPKLAVKVIDACHSGVTYVKNAKSLEKTIEASKGGYENCYFMFSSQKNESSYQDAHLSDFTESFARSLHQHRQDSIRYRDISDYISDEFKNRGQQTPYFVVQSDMTDVFCNISTEMREELSKVLGADESRQARLKQDLASTQSTTSITSTPPEPKAALRDVVIQDAKRYCTETEALSAIAAIKQHIEGCQLASEFCDLFKVDIICRSSFSSTPHMEAVADWLHQNTHEYFVKVQYRTEKYEDTVEVPKKFFGLLGRQLSDMAALRGEYETKVVTRTRKIPDGISLSVTPSFCAAEIKLVPLYENLPWLSENIVVVFSKAFVRLFYSTVRLKETSWSERHVAEDVKWKTIEVGLKEGDELRQVVESIFRELETVAKKMLYDKFKIADSWAILKGKEA
jgi:hypothetical protein